MTDTLQIVPITLKQAGAFCNEVHRHLKAPVGAKFAIGCSLAGRLVGVAIVGRPNARRLQDGFTCEITRLATDGTPNACSKLYRRAARAAQQMGYTRVISYTLQMESGVSLTAAGFELVNDNCGGGSWSVPSRPRVDKHSIEKKKRWGLKLEAA